MAQRAIREILVDDQGHLLVRPTIPEVDYDLIYRAAAGIRWEAKLQAFVAYEPDRWEHAMLFQQIVMAVRNEYGDCLLVSNETRWTNVPDEIRKTISALPPIRPL
jgi:hypothetical protein